MDKQHALRRLARQLGGQKEKPVYLICGAPGSGKSTWVRQNAGKNDLILDLDDICAALSGHGAHEDHRSVLRAALAAREAILDHIRDREGGWERAYVITTANRPDALSLAQRLSAQIVKMQAAPEQIREQIYGDATRAGREDYYIGLAEQWLQANSDWGDDGQA